MNRRIAIVVDPTPPHTPEILHQIVVIAQCLGGPFEVTMIGPAGDTWRAPDTVITEYTGDATANALRTFAPDAVVHIPRSPLTFRTLSRMRTLRRGAPGARHVAWHPARFEPPSRLVRCLAPEQTWVCSYRSLLNLKRASIKGDILWPAAGYSAPLNREARAMQRKQLGVRDADFLVVCETGDPAGNLFDVIDRLAAMPSAVVVVHGRAARLHARANVRAAQDGGSELARLGDVYVHAVKRGKHLPEVPSGVLEALAAGVPVATTAFGGIRDVLIEGEDVRFWEDPHQLTAAIDAMRASSPACRSMADHSCAAVAARVSHLLGWSNSPSR